MANVGTAAAGKTLIGNGNGASPTFADIGTDSGLTAHGVVISEGNAAFVAVSPGSTGQVLTSNGAGLDPSFQNLVNIPNWIVVTSATNPNALSRQTGYIPKGAGVVTFTLPAAAAIGDTFNIAGYGNLWVLNQNAGQSVTLGVSSTTVGVGGSITASQVRDSIEIVCVTTNTEFQIVSGIGNLVFV